MVQLSLKPKRTHQYFVRGAKRTTRMATHTAQQRKAPTTLKTAKKQGSHSHRVAPTRRKEENCKWPPYRSLGPRCHDIFSPRVCETPTVYEVTRPQPQLPTINSPVPPSCFFCIRHLVRMLDPLSDAYALNERGTPLFFPRFLTWSMSSLPQPKYELDKKKRELNPMIILNQMS